MQFQPSSAAASIAGVPRAAVRSGTLDGQRQQMAAAAVSAKPAGKSADSAEIDAGNQTSDRRGDGRQSLDTFERRDRNAAIAPQPTSEPPRSNTGKLDYQA